MPTSLQGKIIIAAADGTNPHSYTLVDDPESKKRGWFDRSVSAQDAEPELVHKTWEFFGGGCGETHDLGLGGYYSSEDCYVGNPFCIRPRPTVTGLTLTGNATPPEWMFEAASASGAKYLYALAGTKVFKVRLADKTLVNTRELQGATVNFKTGSYTGDGSGPRAITDLGFAPDVVILVNESTYGTLIRTAGMTTTKLWTGESVGLLITSLDADGFTVSTTLNTSATIYRWIALKEAAGYVDIGSYAGDSSATHGILGIGFLPDVVWVWDEANVADGAEVVSRHSTHAVDNTIGYHDAAVATNCIRTLDADGFTVGNNLRVNTTGHTYRYLAIKALGGFCAVGTYTGNGADNRDITGVGFDPQYAIVSRYGTPKSVHRSDKNSGDSSMYFDVTANGPNLIQSLITDGFQVGSNASVNASGGAAYHWIAFRSMSGLTPIFGRTAEWNSIMHLPCGKDVPFKRLTTVSDGTDDDVWTATGIYAQHFAVVENALVRAFSDRIVDKCAATDASVAGNWGADYSVGQPGEIITDLIAVGNELGICTNRNFYLFDTVSVAKPMLGTNKPANADNGKGALQWMERTLLPYGRLWGYSAGATKPVDVDSLGYAVPVPDVGAAAVKLTHYGLAAQEDWIYAAVKTSGGKYYLLTARPKSAGFKWDPLHYGGAIVNKVVFIDSTPRLWMGSNNGLAHFPLAADGSPEGGTYGQETEGGKFYLPETDMGTSALKRLAVIEVMARNSQSWFSFSTGVNRDGVAGSALGDIINADGLTERYFTPGTNDTAKRIRTWISWATTPAFTPTSTAPEVFRVTLRGEALPKDADLIDATVILSGRSGVTAETELARLKAHIGGGARRVYNPDGRIIYATIYQVDRQELTPEPGKSPLRLAVLHMRRSDTS